MRYISMCLILAASCLGAAAVRADVIVVGGKELTDVTVVSFTDDKLLVRQGNKYVKYDAAKIDRIEIKGEDLLNKAEQLLADGKVPQAQAAYQDAYKKAKGRWHIALAKRRMELAKSATPKVTPTSQPTDAQPATMPAPGRELDSIQDMLKSCGTIPADPRHAPNWDSLGKGDQADALKAHNRLMEQWEKDHAWRGKAVHWTLTLTGSFKTDAGVVLRLSSGEQITVDAWFGQAAIEQISKLVPGKPVRVSGTLKDYTYKAGDGSVFQVTKAHLDVTLEDAYLGDKPPATQPATTTAPTGK